MPIGLIILLAFIGFITILTLLLGREVLSLCFLFFLFIIVLLGLFFVIAVMTFNWEMALQFFILIMFFLNITFFLVYFIPIGVIGRKFSLPFATISIILLNILIYFISRPENTPSLLEGLVLKYNILSTVSFFTAMFHHANIYHILFNMLFLWIFGSYLEERIGWKKLSLFYLVSGVAASLWQMVFMIVTMSESWMMSVQLGTSGAISGIMGVFLMRCRHTKIRFIPNPFIVHLVGFPRLNSDLFVAFSFLTELIVAFFGGGGKLYTGIRLAAHITGFLIGIALTRSKEMKDDAFVEGLYNSALEGIQYGNKDMRVVEENFLEVIKQRPNFAEPYLHLARLFSAEEVASEDGFGRMPEPKGRYYYEKAIQLYSKSSWKFAGELFGEYFRKYLQPLEDKKLHIKASKELIKLKNYNLAERALEALTKSSKEKDPIIEEAYLLRGKLLDEILDLRQPAIYVYDEFLKRFPHSQFREKVIERLKRMGVEVMA